MFGKTTAAFAAILLLSGTYLALGNEKQSKALQGVWEGAKGDEKVTLTFDGDKFTFKVNDGTASGTFTIDAAKKPMQMDMKVTKGTGEHMKEYEGKTAKAIFELDGDKLKWCSNEPGKEARPGDFTDKKMFYVEFKRAKKK
jgi:uncharacterized protein (TIGR03067 family)